MMNFRIAPLVFATLFAAIGFGSVGTKAQESLQIRIEDICRVGTERVRTLTGTPLYQKALNVKKKGKLNPMQQERLRKVEMYRSMMQIGKCKKIP